MSGFAPRGAGKRCEWAISAYNRTDIVLDLAAVRLQGHTIIRADSDCPSVIFKRDYMVVLAEARVWTKSGARS